MSPKPKAISKNLVYRLPVYLTISRRLAEEGSKYITAPQISEITGINVETVKKDLSIICETPGNPKLGRDADLLIKEMIDFGVYAKLSKAIIMGVGYLGRALINYTGFNEWGLDISAGFDNNVDLANTTINSKPIYPLSSLKDYIKDHNIEIAVVTVPKESAQGAIDLLAEAGIKAIWNFAPVHVNVPKDVILQNENMASNLSLLNYNLNLSKSKNNKKKTK